MNQKRRYGKENRDRAVRMVLEQVDEYGSQWAAVVSAAAGIPSIKKQSDLPRFQI